MATMSSSMAMGLGMGGMGYDDQPGPSSTNHYLPQSLPPQPPQHSYPYNVGGQNVSSHHDQQPTSMPRHTVQNGLHIDTTPAGINSFDSQQHSGPSTGSRTANSGFEHLTAALPPTHPYLGHQQPPMHAMANGNGPSYAAQPPQGLPNGYPPNAMPSYQAQHPQQPPYIQHSHPMAPPTHPGQLIPGFTFGHPPPLPPPWSNGAVAGPSSMPMGMMPPSGSGPQPPPPGYMDWDEGDYLDGGDMMYGQLEVSLSPSSPGRSPLDASSPYPSQHNLPSPVSPHDLVRRDYSQGGLQGDEDVEMGDGWDRTVEGNERTSPPIPRIRPNLKIDTSVEREPINLPSLDQGWITPAQLLATGQNPSPTYPPGSNHNHFPSVPPPATPIACPRSQHSPSSIYPSPLTPPRPTQMGRYRGSSPSYSTYTYYQPPLRDCNRYDYREASPDANLQVKHRRRTTPEQLKVLEHWFDINPKPDNNLREWLAMELGMTKRNVQVWFQNRRAKVKGIALKEKAAAAKAAQEAAKAETVKTPENQPDTPPNPTVPAGPGGAVVKPEMTPSPERASDARNEQQQPKQEQPAPVPQKAENNAAQAAVSSVPSGANASVRTPPTRPAPLHLHSQPILPTSLILSSGGNSGVPLTALPISSHASQSSLLPPVPGYNFGRRASLANGEAARMDAFMAKQRQAARKASGAGGYGFRQPGLISPVRSPVMASIGTANMARRTSGPYPHPPPPFSLVSGNAADGLQVGYAGNAPGSPKISPSVRPSPSALHLAAMRNNSRRASMPGIAGQVQLISSGPFTPPRVVSGNGLAPNQNMLNLNRELSPIKDHDDGMGQLGHTDPFVFPDTSDLSTTYLTPPSSTYLPNTNGTTGSTYLSDSSSAHSTASFEPFTPAGPGPNPGFSFGSGMSSGMPVIGEVDNADGDGAGGAGQGQGNEQGLNWIDMMQMQPRGRLGSIASIGTYTTDGATTVDGGSDAGWVDWAQLGAGGMGMGTAGGGMGGFSAGLLGEGLAGFDPDMRRASAPADLLHDLHLGVFQQQQNANANTSAGSASGSTNPSTPLRPSPLGNNYAPDPLGGEYNHPNTYDMGWSQSNGSSNDNGQNNGEYTFPLDLATSADTSSAASACETNSRSGSSGTSPTDPASRGQNSSIQANSNGSNEQGKMQLSLSMSGLHGQHGANGLHQPDSAVSAASTSDVSSAHPGIVPGFTFGTLNDGANQGQQSGYSAADEYDWFNDGEAGT